MEGYSVNAVFGLKDNLSAPLDNIRRGLDDVNEKPKKISASLSEIAKGAGVFTLVNKGIDTFKDNLGSAVTRFDTLNQYPKVMAQMGYSTDDANNAMNKLKNGIEGLPTKLDDITKSAQQFAIITGSATKGSAVAIAMNDAFTASGASAMDASRGVEQYSQMLSAGVVDMQSWRTLEETMPYALQEVAKSFGLAGSSAKKDLYAKLQSGQITMQQLNDKFVELDGGANGFAKTARTATSGIGTSFMIMRVSVIKGITSMIQSLDDGLKKAGIAKGIAGVFDEVTVGINKSFEIINKVIAKAIPLIVDFVQNNSWMFNTLGGIIKAMLPVIGMMGGSYLTVAGSMWAFTKATNGLASAFDLIYKHPIIATVFAIGTAIVWAYQNVKPFRDAVNKLAKEFYNATNEIGKHKKAVTGLKVAFSALAGGAGILTVVVALKKFKNGLNDVKKASNIGDKFKQVGKSAESGSKGTSKMSNSLLKISLSVAIISESLGFLAYMLTKLAKTGNSGANVISSFGLAIMGIIATLGIFGPALNGSVVGMLGLSALFLSIGGAIAIASVGLSKLVDSLNVFVETLDQSSDAGQNLHDIIESIGTGFADMILGFQTTLLKGIPNVVEAFMNMFIQIVSIFGIEIPNLIDQFTGMLIRIVQAITDNIVDVVSAGVDMVIALANGIVDNAFRLIDSGITLLDRILHGITDNLGRLTDTAIDFITRLAYEIGYAAGRLWGSGNMLMDQIVDGFKDGYNKSSEAGDGAVGSIGTAISGHSLFGHGFGMMDGFVSGLKSAWNAGKNFINSIGPWIKKHKGPISYDRKLLIPAGNAIMSGLNGGLQDGFADVQDNVSSMAEELQNNFNGSLDGNVNMKQSQQVNRNIEWSISGQTLSILQEIKQAILDGNVEVGPDGKPKSLNVNLNMGSNSFSAFVDDVSNEQGKSYDLRKNNAVSVY